MGMTLYYRKFIQKFSAITAPITNLLKSKQGQFKWTTEAERAFNKIKTILTTPPILIQPNYKIPFHIHCDASEIGLGGVLMQTVEENDKVIAYYSTKLTPTKSRYSPTERECLAVIKAIEKFRPYVEGAKFAVKTDAASLRWLKNMKDPNSKLARWSLRLQAYDFELIHRRGKENVVPDALSRAPVQPKNKNTTNEICKITTSTPESLYENAYKKAEENPENDKEKIKNNRLYTNTGTNKEQKWRICICTSERR